MTWSKGWTGSAEQKEKTAISLGSRDCCPALIYAWFKTRLYWPGQGFFEIHLAFGKIKNEGWI